MVIVVIGVQVSVRAQLALVLISSAIVAGFSIHIVVRGGLGGHSLSLRPFNPSSVAGLDLLYGVLYGINMFIGFESAANLAEETDQPKRHVPRAMLWSLTIVGAYFVLTAYAQDVGFGLNSTAWKASVFPLQALASGAPFGSPGFGDVISVLIILDITAVAIGVCVAASRGMLAMARADRLPSALATVHPRLRTPTVGAALIGIVSVVAIVLVVLRDGVFSRVTGQPGVLQPQWAPMFGWMVGFAATGLALMYLVVSVAGVRGLWHEVNRVKLLIAATAGVLVSAGGVFGALYKATSPLNTVPWALGGWIAAGLLWSLAVAVRNLIEPASLRSAHRRRGQHRHRHRSRPTARTRRSAVPDRATGSPRESRGTAPGLGQAARAGRIPRHLRPRRHLRSQCRPVHARDRRLGPGPRGATQLDGRGDHGARRDRQEGPGGRRRPRPARRS
jgi:amino acid transporter